MSQAWIMPAVQLLRKVTMKKLLAALLIALLLGLAFCGGRRGDADVTGALHNCPQQGHWSIATWSGPDNTPATKVLATCGRHTVTTAYYLDPVTGFWSRWFADKPDVSNIQPLDDMQGILTLGAATQPRYSACLVDQAGVGVNTEWALALVEQYWGVSGEEDCVTPDVHIEVQVFHGQQPGGTFYPATAAYTAMIELNSGLFTVDGGNMPGTSGREIGLLHEWGHFAGLSHLDKSSVMYWMLGRYPTDADRALVAGFGKE